MISIQKKLSEFFIINMEQDFHFELKKSEIEDAWKKCRVQLLSDSCRTGRVFKLQIGDKFYAVKVPEVKPTSAGLSSMTFETDEPPTLADLVNELIVEKNAYQRLWQL